MRDFARGRVLLFALGAVMLTAGCSAGQSTEQVTQTQDAIDSAVTAPVDQVLFGQMVSSWTQMQSEADAGCLDALTGVAHDPALFDGAAADYVEAQAGFVTLDRGIPAGYPAAIPDFGGGDWCDVSTELKAARS